MLEGGLEGPPTPDTDPPYDAAPGGDAAELLAVACSDPPAGGERLSTVAEAVRLGQALLLQ